MSDVSCAHNAPGQALVVGRLVPCRKCGMLIEPDPNTVPESGTPGQARKGAPGSVRYPGGHNG